MIHLMTTQNVLSGRYALPARGLDVIPEIAEAVDFREH